MSSKLSTATFLVTVLALSGVALAQQVKGNGGQSATHGEAVMQGTDRGRVRVPGPVRLRHAETGCTIGTCSEPPRRAERAETVMASDACSSLGTARDRNGRAIRRLCAFN